MYSSLNSFAIYVIHCDIEVVKNISLNNEKEFYQS